MCASKAGVGGCTSRRVVFVDGLGLRWPERNGQLKFSPTDVSAVLACLHRRFYTYHHGA